jgi:hypothetical protein
MRIQKGESTARLDNVKLREYFRKYGHRKIDDTSLAKTFLLSRKKAEERIGDLVSLGLICRSDLQADKAIVCYETTIQGNAFGMAKAGKPVSRESTEKVLREFLERVNAVNERRDLAHRVESVIVFGSYLSEVSRLNDLDLSVELVGNGTDDASQQVLREASFNRARASGRQFRNAVDQIFWPRMEVLSFLKNRSRTISFCEWDSLKDMPKLRYAVLLGDKSRIATFIRDGDAVDLPADRDAVDGTELPKIYRFR